MTDAQSALNDSLLNRNHLAKNIENMENHREAWTSKRSSKESDKPLENDKIQEKKSYDLAQLKAELRIDDGANSDEDYDPKAAVDNVFMIESKGEVVGSGWYWNHDAIEWASRGTVYCILWQWITASSIW